MRIYDRNLKPNLTEELVEFVYRNLKVFDLNGKWTPINSIDQFWTFWNQGEGDGYCHRFNKEISDIKDILRCSVIPTSCTNETLMELTKFLNVLNLLFNKPKIDILVPHKDGKNELVNISIGSNNYQIAMIDITFLDGIEEDFKNREGVHGWTRILRLFMNLNHDIPSTREKEGAFASQSKEEIEKQIEDVLNNRLSKDQTSTPSSVPVDYFQRSVMRDAFGSLNRLIFDKFIDSSMTVQQVLDKISQGIKNV